MNWSLSICCSPSICYSKYLSKCNQNRSCSFCWMFQFSWIFLPSMNPFSQSQAQLHPRVWHSQLSLSHKPILSFIPKIYLSSAYILSTASQTSVPKGPQSLKFSKNNGLDHVPSRCYCMFIPKSIHCCCISIKRMNTGFDYFLKTSLYGTHSHF